MEKIIDYLLEKYNPKGMIVYGSFANGTNNLNSDFDAMLICDETETEHDNSIVDGTELDVFLYPKSVSEENYDILDFIQIWDGKIIMDELGIVSKLKQEAEDYIRNYIPKSESENTQSLEWCEKMLGRTKRNDMEGFYRLHWLLVDTLEIYCDLKGKFYFGPKKALKQMEQTDEVSANIYFKALQEPTEENVSAWIERLKKCR